ncbi:cytochrome b/b6 domain-containing protein [Alterisphingorhabdus coralli]|uniref:Cytochrome b/b6 domain-containing protein n=1 Tax=Alterisphingorhabdus coralli TaxID=3071408 RepID=A0AA97F5U8_9SPHN|nr:cytochrome b/b6 domain-containing protein [Parasphingorhabdus sp. SCSIO 66989]WOE74503.1 cytochrome b/b6 domain-containing protein [Parasphingorhabdus sp. SCSIO 66989]
MADNQQDTIRTSVKRHGLVTRLWHWTNAVTLLVLLMSGFTIFNAHPRLYWGDTGNNFEPAWLAIGTSETRSYVRINRTKIPSTGVIGHWRDDAGRVQNWAFPDWATIPSRYDLAAGRQWHFFFAWILSISLLLFMVFSLFNKHIANDLHMRREDWSPRNIAATLWHHVRLRFPKGREALRYNSLQKLSYIGVIFIALPLMIATGLAMSPQMNAAMPWLPELFGGRQSARSWHFIIAFALVAFFLVHMLMVLLSGPIQQLRGITSGRVQISEGSE